MAVNKKPEGFASGSVEIQELSEGELKFGYWFVSHKAGIRKFLIICLIIFCVLTFSYVFFSLGRYYFIQYGEYQTSLATLSEDLVNVQGQHILNQVQPLELLTRDILPGDRGKVDIAIRVRNPNLNWGLNSVVYQVSLGGKFYDKQTSFVLPGEEKYFMILNVDGNTSGTPQIFFENEEWTRVTKYETWGPERTNFVVNDQKFSSARQSELSGQLPISEVTATIFNDTAFNYNEVIVQTALFSGTRLAGISKVPIGDFRSRQTRPLVTRWTQSLPSISKVEVIPSVNILDDSVYSDF